MNGARAPDVKENVKIDYLNGMKYKELAEKYDVSINTIKSWIKRYGWSQEKKEKGAHKNKKGAPFNNKNAKGHGAPVKNKNAETHGFFSKYLPKDTLEIIQDIKEKDPLDILWENINIQYAAIIRSQNIMYVKNQNDVTQIVNSEMTGDKADSTSYLIQTAIDKQATFLQAQSRAMKTLESMIKQYDELLNSSLATEEQKARIEVLKSKVPNKDKLNIQGQINALADIINNPKEREPLENE